MKPVSTFISGPSMVKKRNCRRCMVAYCKYFLSLFTLLRSSWCTQLLIWPLILDSIDSTLYPTPLNLIFKSTWRYIPEFLLRYVRYLPTREYRRFRTYLDCSREFSRGIIKRNAEKRDGTDMMSMLLRTNESEKTENRLTDEEIVDQLS